MTGTTVWYDNQDDSFCLALNGTQTHHGRVVLPLQAHCFARALSNLVE